MGNIYEETRGDTMKRSIKQGMMKESLDKVLNDVAKKLSTAMKPMLKKIHPKVDFLDPAVESGLEWAVLQVFSELVRASGSMATRVPGLENVDDMESKAGLVADAMIGYSGERLGDKASQAAILFLPMVKQFLSDASLAGIFGTGETSNQLDNTKLVSFEEETK